ncbi:MAG: ACT domain-containing protein [Ruminococcus sp.]|nr:ACT domain-containing protein [Ruminococcus sp.]
MAETEGKSRLVIVSEQVLPEIISKVLEAKRLRAGGEAATSAEACRAVGISRSAYYKYKDQVWGYEEQFSNRIISVYLLLRDEKGVLSSIIQRLYELGANILTINQNIPIDSVATVTVSVRYEQEGTSSILKSELANIKGVVDVKIISGE